MVAAVKIVFLTLIFYMLWSFPQVKKWAFLTLSNYITVRTNSKLILCKIMNKYGNLINFILGLVIGGSLTWMLFRGNDDLAWVTFRDVVINGLNWWRDIAIFISPYGRITNMYISGNLKWLLDLVSLAVLCVCIFWFVVLFSKNSRFFLVKTVVVITFAMGLWYGAFFGCIFTWLQPSLWQVYLGGLLFVVLFLSSAFLLSMSILELDSKLNS